MATGGIVSSFDRRAVRRFRSEYEFKKSGSSERTGGELPAGHRASSNPTGSSPVAAIQAWTIPDGVSHLAFQRQFGAHERTVRPKI
jgi:hypothetical protein